MKSSFRGLIWCLWPPALGLSVAAVIIGTVAGINYLARHKNDNKRADYSCYSIFESSYEAYPEVRMFILKAKADKVFTNRECHDLMDMTSAIRDRRFLADQDNMLNSIGEKPIE